LNQRFEDARRKDQLPDLGLFENAGIFVFDPMRLSAHSAFTSRCAKNLRRAHYALDDGVAARPGRRSLLKWSAGSFPKPAFFIYVTLKLANSAIRCATRHVNAPEFGGAEERNSVPELCLKIPECDYKSLI